MADPYSIETDGAVTSYDRTVLGLPHREIPENRVVEEHDRTPHRRVLAVKAVMRLPRCGLLTWFDGKFTVKDGVENHASPDPNLAFFFPVARGLDNVLHGRPFNGKLVDIAHDSALDAWYRLMVWIGRDVIEADEVHFTAVLAHEWRHVEQFICKPQLHYAGCVVMAYLRWLEELERSRWSYYDSPVEWDAEARARIVAVQIFGEDPVRTHYASRGLEQFVQQPTLDTPADVLDKVCAFLKTHSAGLVALYRRSKIDDRVYRTFGHLLEDVEWPSLGLPDPRLA